MICRISSTQSCGPFNAADANPVGRPPFVPTGPSGLTAAEVRERVETGRTNAVTTPTSRTTGPVLYTPCAGNMPSSSHIRCCANDIGKISP